MEQSLRGRKVAITSGPTRAPIDAVRYITNRSTGALGVAIAEECLTEGARVTFFRGAGSLVPPQKVGVETVEIETVDDLVRALERKLPKCKYDVIFHAMAVLDYVPEKELKGKIRSGKGMLRLRLVKTAKVINLIKRLSRRAILVGFKLEVGATKIELAARARTLMRSSGADFVFANDLRTVRKGRHVGYLLDGEGNFRGPFKGKREIARALVEAVSERMGSPKRTEFREERFAKLEKAL